MFPSWSRSYALVQQSWNVLKQDKEIMIFPVLSGLVSMAVGASFIVPIVLMLMHQGNAPHPAGTHEKVHIEAAWYAYMFLFYLCSYFVTIFFNVGVMKCAAIRMDGGDPTVADGFKGAFAHIGGIFMWSLVSATIGMILRAIERRAGLLGSIAASILGIAWTFLTYFAVPVIIFENTDALTAIKRSGELFKRTWGEAVVGQSGMGLVFGVLSLLGLFPIVAAVFLLSQGSVAVPVAVMLVATAIAYWIAIAVVSAALQGVYHVALYRYASTGQIAGGFSQDLVAGNWVPKTARAGFFG